MDLICGAARSDLCEAPGAAITEVSMATGDMKRKDMKCSLQGATNSFITAASSPLFS